MGHWRNAVILMLALPCARARQNSTSHLRVNSLSTQTLLVELGQHAAPGCQCTFDDRCSCQGALKFMECVKTACNSGSCQCMEKDGTNHFQQSCAAMADECPGVGLVCDGEMSTCKDSGVAWHQKVKGHAVDEDAAKADEKKEEKEAVEVDPKKYVLHKKYKSTVRALESHGHRVFAQGVIAAIMVLSVTVCLASSPNTIVAKNTWSIIDFTVVTFLALSWFIVVIHSLDYFQYTGIERILVHMTVAVLFLLASAIISYRLKNSEGGDGSNADTNPRSAIFNGIFTPMVMWCNAGFVETVQKYFKDSAWQVFVFILVLTIWYGLLFLIFNAVVGRFLTKRGFGDDTENAMAGGALAGGFVLWCHHAISGSYQTIEQPRENPPSLFASWMLVFLSIFFLGISLGCLPPVSRSISTFKEDWGTRGRGYWKLRFFQVLSKFLKHLPHFSFIMSLSHLVLYHSGYLNGSVGAQLLLALTSTLVGILMIVVCAYVPALKKDNDVARESSDMLIGLGGLMIGVAWSGMLDNSINMMIKGKGYEHPFRVKLLITGFLSLFVFPVYCCYLKPIIMRKT